MRKTGAPRSVTPPTTPSRRPYKAIVYINLAGGVDSFNILTPHSNGKNCALYDEYFEARGGQPNTVDEGRRVGIGLRETDMLDIDGTSQNIENCDRFGVNSMLKAYKDIFDDKKGLFFANSELRAVLFCSWLCLSLTNTYLVGHLHKPVTKDDWETETRTDLFSHHTMKHESFVVDAFREGEGPGVLGRFLDVLEQQGTAVAASSIGSRAVILDGNPDTGRLADNMAVQFVPRLFDRNFLAPSEQRWTPGAQGIPTLIEIVKQDLRGYLEELHSETNELSGVFGDLFSRSFIDNWNKTDELSTLTRATNLATNFTAAPEFNVGGIVSQLRLVANLIALRNERRSGINRDVFFVEMGGFDAHFKVATVLANKFPSLNKAVELFWEEIKAQGIANSVVVIQGSEFGRTITPNSNAGSDHAWGGNYFMFG